MVMVDFPAQDLVHEGLIGIHLRRCVMTIEVVASSFS
jgi:hypothetical protein